MEDILGIFGPPPPEPTPAQYAAAAKALETPPSPIDVLSFHGSFLNHAASCDDGHAHEGPAFWLGVVAQANHQINLRSHYANLAGQETSQD